MSYIELNKAKSISLIYLLLCFLAFVFYSTRHEYDKFSAMFLALLTSPWSFFIARFNGKFGIEYELTFQASLFVFTFCMLLNLIIIFKFFNWLDKEKKKYK
jgi:formate hydrogenlyase subunit 3/multisubunit Na+/H+ antiporter MnhD subunit